MYYFRFEIPTMPDGKRVTYSPGWHGTMPKCPRDVEVLLYNDKEGFGIAKSEDAFVPQEVTAVTEKEALDLVAAQKDEDGVYFGQKLADRWLPEAETEDTPDTPETLEEVSTSTKTAVDTMLKYCPTCHQLVAFLTKYSDGSVKIVQNGKTLIDGIICKSIVLTCPAGHKVKVVCNGR